MIKYLSICDHPDGEVVLVTMGNAESDIEMSFWLTDVNEWIVKNDKTLTYEIGYGQEVEHFVVFELRDTYERVLLMEEAIEFLRPFEVLAYVKKFS